MDCILPEILDSWLLPFLHLYSGRATQKLQALGLYPGQLPLLFLAEHQEGLSLRQMADILHVKPPTVTVSVQRLERMGLMEKRPDEKDQRTYRIFLTEKAKDILGEAKRIAIDNAQTATQGISPDELAILKDCFTRMTENLKRDAKGQEVPCCSFEDA